MLIGLLLHKRNAEARSRRSAHAAEEARAQKKKREARALPLLGSAMPAEQNAASSFAPLAMPKARQSARRIATGAVALLAMAEPSSRVRSARIARGNANSSIRILFCARIAR